LIHDFEAWEKYPHHHKWFNKLYLAELMGYKCGPTGLAPDVTDHYIVRPIYNLSGMGVGSKVIKIEAGDATKVPPGYFWCEFIAGIQYSATYEFVDGRWKSISCWQGTNDINNLSRFVSWIRSTYKPKVSSQFNELHDVGRINIEFIGDKPIEVHLRESPDPNYDELIPVWADNSVNKEAYLSRGYRYIESYDDANGFLEIPRIGFLVK
jgi:hypothetical protein